MRPRLFRYTCSTALAASLALSGCASFPILKTGASPARNQDRQVSPAMDSGREPLGSQPPSLERIQIPSRTAVPPIKADSEIKSADIVQLLGEGNVNVSLPPQPLPQFLDTVFGEILKAPYALGPNVSNRQEIITLRSSPDMPRAQFFALLQGTLRDYGIGLTIRNGSVMVLDDNSPTSEAATILRSRSASDTPEAARSVVQFFQLQTLDSNAVYSMVKDLFPASRTISVESDPGTNTLVLKGSGRDVQSVVSFLQILDQPVYAGTTALRFRPVYWGADAFAGALEQTLITEGYKVSRNNLALRPIMILTMPNTGQVLVFAADEGLAKRVQFWADTLDQPSGMSDQKSTFVYDVQYAIAADLVSMVIGNGAPGATTSQLPTGVAGSPPVSAQSTSNPSHSMAGGVVASGGTVGVDPMGNRILFTGSATQFSVLRNLLQQLDKPSPQVMIEVTVAEVTLTDSTKLGLEWFFTKSAMGGTFSGGTDKGLGIGSAGFAAKFVGTDLRAAFNAFASNNKVNIISRPQLTAKSGEHARIQVGTDVPIITSQSASNVQTGGGTQVLQSVQYRQTGVILDITPTVYGDNRVDLDITQEVSKAGSSANSAIASPPILNRSLSTKISLTDGATHVMGGLMDDNFSKANTGIPFLKDIPLIGNAFRTDAVDGTKTELVLLVTPFILRDSDDMAMLANQMSGNLNKAFRVGRGGSYTLTGVSTGLNLGISLPPARTSVAGRGRYVPPAKTPKRRSSAPSPSVQP